MRGGHERRKGTGRTRGVPGRGPRGRAGLALGSCLLLAVGIGVLPALTLARQLSGTAGRDRISGTQRGERISAKGGADVVWGRGGEDTLLGAKGRDALFGGSGADRVLGGAAADRLLGGSGADALVGGPGPDRIVGGPGEDQLNAAAGARRGAAGNDVILARDGSPDLIECGPGNDRAIVDDVEEGVYDCETVVYP